MTELGFCTLFWELTGLFFALTVPLTHSQTLDDAAIDTGQALNLAAGETVLLQKKETFVPFGTVHGLNTRAAVQVEFLPDQADSLAIRQSGPLGDVQAFRFFPALAEPEKAIQPGRFEVVRRPDVLMPAAPRIILAFCDTGLRRVVVDIAHNSEEIRIVLDGLTAIAVLEQMTAALVLFVVVIGIAAGKALHQAVKGIGLLKQEMDVVIHQAVREDLKGFRRLQAAERIQIVHIVLPLLEEDLMGNAARHHMIEAASAQFAGLSRHVYHLGIKITESAICVKRTVPLTQ